MFFLKDLKMVRTLGEGAIGRVFLVSFQNVSQVRIKKLYAMKVMSKAKILKNRQKTHIYNEKAVMLSLYSPFFVKLYSTFQDRRFLYMIMEYIPGGELLFYMKREGIFSPKCARFYISEILVALDLLHSQGIVYRDLKPENILLDSSGHIKIADFGFSKRIEAEITKTLCGTPEYLAPEIIQNLGHSFEVDFWSLGIILYEMIVGNPPFYNENQVELCKMIVRGELWFPPYIDGVVKDLICKLLTVDRKERLGHKGGAREIFRHPFFQNTSWVNMQQRFYTPPIVPCKPKENVQPCSYYSLQADILSTMPLDLPERDDVFSKY